MEPTRFDSLIFDMDGTLWDAVDSYCEIWNETLRQCGYTREDVTRDELIEHMGSTLDRIIADLTPDAAADSNFFVALDRNEQTMMPRLGGQLYPGVKELIPLLASRYRLFMVSNCSAEGLPNFLNFTGLKPYFTDTLSFGQTHCGKDANISRLAEMYGLTSPLYVGDTQGDADACRRAGVLIAWASYGFGHIDDPDFTLKRFDDLKQIVL